MIKKCVELDGDEIHVMAGKVAHKGRRPFSCPSRSCSFIVNGAQYSDDIAFLIKVQNSRGSAVTFVTQAPIEH